MKIVPSTDIFVESGGLDISQNRHLTVVTLWENKDCKCKHAYIYIYIYTERERERERERESNVR